MTTPFQIVADVGGTNARFALVDITLRPSLQGLQYLQKFQCADFDSLVDVIKAYLQLLPASTRVGRMCICIAGAVDQDEIFMPNRGWTFSQHAVSAEIGLPIHFINDFTAQVHSIATLDASEIEWLGPARPEGDAVFAVIGPGTGLGVGAMTPRQEAVPSEGGHSSFSPQNPQQLRLLEMLWQELPRVDIERVVSGPGLENLYAAYQRLQGKDERLAAREITSAAEQGNADAKAVVQHFFDILAAFASDVAMLMGAVDGVYIVGDLMSQLRDLNDVGRFRHCFNDKENYEAYCSRIPLALVSAQDTGLRGCWRYLELS